MGGRLCKVSFSISSGVCSVGTLKSLITRDSVQIKGARTCHVFMCVCVSISEEEVKMEPSPTPLFPITYVRRVGNRSPTPLTNANGVFSLNALTVFNNSR